MILCGNPHAQYLAHQKEIDEAILQVLGKGRYVLGEEVKTLEDEFASYVGVAHGIGVGSGTEALHLALVACGVEKGDEVITVSHTAVATVAAIQLCGAKPVFVDIERDYYTLDPQKLEKAITQATKAVIPVHLYGQSADLESILRITQKHGLKLIEDCAQAHGAIYQDRKVGSWGDFGCFSFYPTKNLGALGDGGMLVTKDAELAKKARLLREYGWAERYVSHISGWNSRLDEMQAAVLRIKLRYLDQDNRSRVKIAARYDQALADQGLGLPKARMASSHVYHLYVVRSSERGLLEKKLKANDIGALVHYPVPIHLQPAYKSINQTTLEETERAAREVLSLPIYPELKDAEVDTVIEAIKAI